MDPAAEPEIAEAARQMVQDGPVALSGVVQRLVAAGLLTDLRDGGPGRDDGELADLVREEILDHDDLWIAADDSVVLATSLVDGKVLTHRLSIEEIALDRVDLKPDLAVLDVGAGPELDLIGHQDQHLTITVDVAPRGEISSFLVGPDGWLSGFEADQVAAFRRWGSAIEVFAAPEPDDGQREVDSLAATIDRRIAPGDGEDSYPLILDALAADTGAWRNPVSPLGDLLERAGLDRREHEFGRRGEPWATTGERHRKQRREAVEQEWQFEPCCRRAFDVVDAAYRMLGQGAVADIDAGEVRRSLGHGDVAPAFAEYLRGRLLADDTELGKFADRLLAGVSDDGGPAGPGGHQHGPAGPGGHQQGPVLFLAGVAAERSGDLAAAESHLRRSARLDPEAPMTAAILARYQLDRGDIVGAIASLRHPDLNPDSPTLAYLVEEQQRREGPYRNVGRNQACPCGSGRKFKQCCQRSRVIPLADRTALLAHKVAVFAHRPEHRLLLEEVAAAAVDPDEPDWEAAADKLWGNPILMDIGLWEGGLAADYLQARSELLPADERALLTRLVDTPRRLWELTEVDEGVSMVMRDTRTGDMVVVDEHLGSLGRLPGELILGRLASLGDVYQLFGAVVDVPLRLRDATTRLLDAEPEAEDLAAWYGAAIAPPRMVNRDGEPTVLCHAEVVCDGFTDDVVAALDAVFDRQDDDDTWVAWREEPGGERAIRGTIRDELTGPEGHLSVDTNSVSRLEGLLATITSAVPDARVTVNEQISVADLVARHGEDDRAPLEPPAVAPGAEAALDEWIRDKELAWLDEKVPALAGLTPRQAADDPTRREDLVALLREMDRPVVPVGGRSFDAGRLRDLLGLSAGAGPS